jgi:ribosomal protein S18 acetylase RimI-like enzyme
VENIPILTLNENNITDEHICCAISDKKCRKGYESKKAWLKNQFENGYKFKKFDVRGKVFIEYVPVEESWLPIKAPKYMLINCFWVAGQFKGKGYGKKLLNECLNDSKNKDGVLIIIGDKKRPFMNDPKFFKKQGFEIVDTAKPYFQLWCKKNNPNVSDPKFMESAKKGNCSNKKGIVAYYSNCCPFTEFYTNSELRKYAEKKGIPIEIIKITSKNQIKDLPIPWVINSVFYNGELVTLEMKADKKLNKVI